MLPVSCESIENLFIKYESEIKVFSATIKAQLTRLCVTDRLSKKQLLYVDTLISLHKELITSPKKKLDDYKNIFDGILKINKKKKSDVAFRNKILKALQYKTRRSDFYPKYFRELGIKACVYCNSQICVTVEAENKALVAKFQVDHYLPKDEYPCLSVSLYNLYPVCASCNNKKGTKKINFLLYEPKAKISKSKFEFYLIDKPNAISKLVLNGDNSFIKVGFREPKATGNDKSFNTLFSIQGIYSTQVDIVEELILKAQVYTDTYMDKLLVTFPSIFKNKNELKRLIIGNYVEESEIHKRPMAKFTQDIAKQIDLI